MRSGGPELHAELRENPTELAELAPEWRALAESHSNAFVTPEWAEASAHVYGERAVPVIVSVRDGGDRLVGVLPLERAAKGPSTIRFAGSGLGDTFSLLAEPGLEEPVAQAAGRLLAERFGHPTLVLENVSGDAGWWRVLARAAGLGGRPVLSRTATLPYADLGGGFDVYMASRSRNFRSQSGRRRRALEREHTVELRWITDSGEVEPAMRRFFELHDQRWAEREGGSSLTSPDARAFHHRFAVNAAREGWLRLALLLVDGESVASFYGWRLGSTFAYYQAGFNPAWADRSVGHVLLLATVERAASEGAIIYDMLLGDEAYKERFSTASREAATIVLGRRLSGTRLVAASESRARRWARDSLGREQRDRLRAGIAPVLSRLPASRRR